MEIIVTRGALTSKSSCGEMTIEGMHECVTLEPSMFPGSAPRAIPLGRYRVSFERSPRFSELAGHDVSKIRLHDIPGFDGVLMHEGNFPHDTDGCTIVGSTALVDEVDNSLASLRPLEAKVQAAIARGEDVFATYQLAPGLTPP